MGRRDHILLYPVHEKPSIIPNGGFETAGAGGSDVFGSWTEQIAGTSVISADTSTKRSGTQSCKLHFPDGNECYIWQQIGTVGQRYKVSLWAKTAAGGLFIYVAHGTATQALTTTTSWAKYVFFITCTANDVFRVSRNGAGGTAWIDDVVVQKA